MSLKYGGQKEDYSILYHHASKNGKVLKDKKFNAIPFSSQDAARTHALTLARKKNIPLSQLKLTRSWMDAPEQSVAESESNIMKGILK